MKLKNLQFALNGIVHMSDVLPTIGIVDSDAADEFTANISSITWGDANYTLIDIRTFWKHFIQDSFQVQMGWPEFEKSMLDNSVKYINLEG